MKAESKNKIQRAERTVLEQSVFDISALDFQLKIGYDGKRATNNLTGLGNYSRSLIEHLAVQFPENQYVIYASKIKEQIKKFALFLLENVSLRFPEANQNKFLWRSIGIKKTLSEDKIDIFHGLSHEIPNGLRELGIKGIVTIHDLIFLKRPQDYQLIDRLIYKYKSKKACQNADRIIAISEKTKQDIIELYGTDPNKIDVIYQSCDDSFKKISSTKKRDEVISKYNLPERYVLNVGTVEPRKNLLLLIEALNKTPDHIPLVVVGKKKEYFEQVVAVINKYSLQPRVIFLENVSFQDLPTIYQLAEIFVYPSFYEGFGIPIIEALYSKTPVIAAKGSCLEEAGGPGSIYIEPDSTFDLASHINLIWDNEAIKQTMIEKGLVYVQKFDAKLVSQQLMDCYQQTLKN